MYSGLFVITSIPDIAHTGISACVTTPFSRKGLVARLCTAYSHNELEVLAMKSKVYQFEMLQTTLV